MEIERKFLVSLLPRSLSDADHAMITQVYLTRVGEETEKRIRMVQGRGDEAYFLTEKRGKGMMREESERSISRAEFDELFRSAVSRAIVKKRYFLPLDGGLYGELDVYEGFLSGLMTVEVEFATQSEAIAFTAPDWFGSEVTDETCYKNRALAEKGLPQ